MLPLELLQVGEEGRVVDVDGGPDAVARLAEMGIRDGAWVRMIQNGCPCIIAIDNHRFTFRDAAAVLVDASTLSRASA